MNADQNSRLHQLSMQALVPEDNKPQFFLEKSSQKQGQNDNEQKSKESSPNDRPLIPMN